MAMADIPDIKEPARNDDDGFFDESYLSYTIPAKTDFVLPSDLLVAQAVPNPSPPPLPLPLSSIQSRESLFFDETITLLVVVETPRPSGVTACRSLCSKLRRVALSVDAEVADARSPGDRGSSPAADVIFSGLMEGNIVPVIIGDDDDGKDDGSDNGDGADENGSNRDERDDGFEANNSAANNRAPDENQDNRKSPPRRHVCAAWKLPIFLRRPRLRFHNPVLTIRVSAHLAPALSAAVSPLKSRSPALLNSGQPASLNLLASLAADPSLPPNATRPHLSALRISRVAPLTRPRSSASASASASGDDGAGGRRLRALPQLRLSVSAAVQTRMRFSRPAVAVPSQAVIVAVVEVDITPHALCEVALEHIALEVCGAGTSSDTGFLGTRPRLGPGLGPSLAAAAAKNDNLTIGDARKISDNVLVEDMNVDIPGMALPMTCVAHDHVTFFYRLSPLDPADGEVSSVARELAITVKATAEIEPGVCTPHLAMRWAAPLDLAAGYPHPHPHPHAHANPTSTTVPPDYLPQQRDVAVAAEKNHVSDLGVTVTFLSSSASPSSYSSSTLSSSLASSASVPPTFSPPLSPSSLTVSRPRRVRPGEVFVWTVHVVNRAGASTSSGGGAPRKFALIPLPWRRRADGRASLRPTTASRQISDAVLDQAVMYALQRNALVDAADVVCLSADVRVGPLAPGACQVVELRFVALHEGILSLEAVRVVDLVTQEHVDVKELPVMVVEGAR